MNNFTLKLWFLQNLTNLTKVTLNIELVRYLALYIIIFNYFGWR